MSLVNMKQITLCGNVYKRPQNMASYIAHLTCQCLQGQRHTEYDPQYPYAIPRSLSCLSCLNYDRLGPTRDKLVKTSH